MRVVYLIVLITVTNLTSLFGQVPKKVLVEEFTQASCWPCAQLNPAFNKLLSANQQNVIPIKYQTSWPGVDPMNEQNPVEVRKRVDYYGVSGVPSAVVNGQNQQSPEDVSQGQLTQEAALTSPISMELTHSINGSFDSTTIVCSLKNVSSGPFDLEKYRLLLVLLEHTINFPTAPGTNNEKEFSDVMRKMIPDAEGTAVGSILKAGEIKEFTFTVGIPPYLYDVRTLSFAAFIQNMNNKLVEQAAYSQPKSLNNVRLFDVSMYTTTTLPSGYCDYTLKPSLVVTNQCTETVQQLKVAYSLNNQPYVFLDWKGEILPGEKVDVIFPPTTVPVGKNSIIYFLQGVNKGLDTFNFNNIPKSESFLTYEPKAFASSVQENLESIATSGDIPHTLQIEKYKNRIEVVSEDYFTNPLVTIPRMGAYEQSDKSIWFFFFNMEFNEKAILMYEKVDLSKSKNSTLYFDHAYAQFNGVENDRLTIDVSSDCGKTWTTVWSKFGKALATTAPQKSQNFPFLPKAADWRSDTVNLSAFDGNEGINFRFLGTSNYGNNLYIDNISLNSGTTQAVDLFKEEKISSYPNPSFTKEPIRFGDGSTNILELKVYDLLGTLLYQCKQSGQCATWTPEQAGTFVTRIKTSSGLFAQKVVVLNR